MRPGCREVLRFASGSHLRVVLQLPPAQREAAQRACGHAGAWLHALEDAHQRDRSGPRFGDRTLDIDIVYFGDQVVNGPGHLQIPRPDIKHAFVLKPLAEIAPDFIDPVRELPLAEMWRAHREYTRAFAPLPVPGFP